MALELRKKRLTQLNEKVQDELGNLYYDILYPETIAAQVITNDDRMFVTKAQIEAWTKGVGSTHFKGEWVTNTAYEQSDIVVCYDAGTGADTSLAHYYICNTAHTASTTYRPQHNNAVTRVSGTLYWYNIDYAAYISEESKQILTQSSTVNATRYLTFVDSNNNTAGYETVYTNSGISYNPSTQTLTVSKLQGTASNAEIADKVKTTGIETNAEYYVTFVDSNNETATAENVYTGSGMYYNPYTNTLTVTKVEGTAAIATDYTNTKVAAQHSSIQQAFEDTNKRIDDIVDGTGGAVLSHNLYIQKNGTTIDTDGFNGSTDKTWNISIAPADVTGLLDDNNKIKETWLPDFVLGNLRYGGTFKEDGVITSSDTSLNGKDLDNLSASSYEGLYFLAAFTDTANGYTVAGVTDVRVGDWLVSNGAAGWTKVDNTDAVTAVNGQIGAVETYKGLWTTNTQYFKGDVVKYDGALYIVNKAIASSSASFNTDDYDIFGRVYGASDGIKLEGTTFKHNVAVEAGATTTSDLLYGASFTVPSLTTDAYGHVTKVNQTTWTMPAATVDTWRAIQVNGTQVLSSNISTNPLNVVNGDLITASYENNSLKLSHNKTNPAQDASSFAPDIIDAVGANEKTMKLGDGFTVPKFSFDAYGHIYSIGSETFRLPTAPITHTHFATSTSDGVTDIHAYDSTTATSTWVGTAANAGKFYTGDVVPSGTYTLNFNGDFVAKTLYQNINGEKKAVLNSTMGIFSGKKIDGTTDIVGSYNSTTGNIEMGDSGVTAGIYSAVAVNAKGVVTYGGSILEFGTVKDADPSASLAVGGLFFRYTGDVAESAA